jgi:hypothetical protein
MNIKHPCKPKPVSCCIPIAILLQDGLHDLKCAVITLVYTRYIPDLEGADSEKISLVYPRHMTFTWKSMEEGYTRYIYLGYENGFHMTGIYLVYPCLTTKMVITLGYNRYIPRNFQVWGFQMYVLVCAGMYQSVSV